MAQTQPKQPKMLGPVAALRLFTDNIKASRTFYEKQLGLDVILSDNEVVVYDLYGIDLVIENVDPSDEAEALIGSFSGISCHVEDCLATYNMLKEKGVEFLDTPAEEPWGGILAHFFDPSGNVLSLVEYPDDSANKS
ncbi:MAG: VOC family protein [Pseudomonadota bacterium]|nr:VOC family protein [Pseudomonadota bacterium]